MVSFFRFMATLYVAPTQNYVQKTISGAIDDTVTTITLSSTTNLQAPGVVIVDRVDTSGNLTPGNREVISYTGIAGAQLTGCTRSAEGSTAIKHADGAVVETMPTVGMWNNLATIVASGFDSNGYLRAINSPASIAFAQLTQANIASIASITRAQLVQAAITSIASISALAVSTLQGWDGWITSPDTYTYVSANSFKITGVDRTLIFTKGTRIKFTNNSTTYYGTVVSSTFSSDTTITLAANSDFSIANSAITLPFYSYEASPAGYPTWYNYSASPTWGSAPSGTTVTVAQFSILGNTLSFRFHQSNTVAGTTTTFNIAQPVAANLANVYHDALVGYVSSSGATITPTNNVVGAVLGATTINIAFPSAAWLCVWLSGVYPI